MTDQSDSSDERYWYKDAIIYELHIKAFYDSNGDGVGDLQGLLEKLDYLEELGVTAIWLLPFYPSPLRDDGYDIADYYSINKSFGNIRVFKQFVKEAHRRGLKVITELVINHTSDQHPWFQRARKSKPGSVYRDYYVWSNDPSKYKDVRIIFTDTEVSNWTWDPVAESYYWHRFFSHQPDLNFDNPSVQREIFKIMDHWLAMGVDGFRLDAVPYLFERENTNCENLPETHQFLKDLRAYVDSKYENKVFLAEANMWPDDSAAYFGDGDECHMNYHFPIMPRMFMALKMEDRYPLTDIIEQTPDIPESCQWAIFLRNHDELTLEMVTDEERDYMYKMYTRESQEKINVGIRRRLAPLLENSRNKIELMNFLLFTLPGTPVIYYGDEIGMGDNAYLGDRDGVRTPMQWDANKNAGFSKTNPHKLYLPVIIDPEYRYESVNVESQLLNTSSLLWWMKRIIAMRKQYKAFGRGDITFLSPSNAKVIAYLRVYEEEVILVLANLSRFPQSAELGLPEYEGYIPEEMFSHNKFPRIDDRPYLFTVAPHGYFWFQLKKERGFETEKDSQPTLKVMQWKDLFAGKLLQRLERRILPKYIVGQRWFGSKARVIKNVSVKEVLRVGGKSVFFKWLIFEVRYDSGLPELYQLPLSFISLRQEGLLREVESPGIIAKMILGEEEEEGLLVDAVFDENFRKMLFMNLRRNRRFKLASGSLIFQAASKSEIKSEQEIEAKILKADQSNTAIVYNGKYFLKLYRKVDAAINPDVEIIRYLTETKQFPYVPRYEGEILLQQGEGQSMPLAMVQEAVANQGDAWEYVMDSLQRYFETVLAQPKGEKVPDSRTGWAEPLHFDTLEPNVQDLIGGIFADRVHLLGERTGDMHRALVKMGSEDFGVEGFTLHYQRSLYSSLQTLTRVAFDALERSLNDLPDSFREEAEEVLQMRRQVLKIFKRIYSHKITTYKTRNHGDYHLGQVLWTGRDFTIIDFEGEPARSYSERRLKRSPLRDVAGMLRSFQYAVFSTALKDEYSYQRKEGDMQKWAEIWYHHVSRIYLKGYLDAVEGTGFVPSPQEDLEILLETYLLEKAVYELNYELNHRPDWVQIPILGIKAIVNRHDYDKNQ